MASGSCVTVSHYPSGASKWNPIEHRLFSQISRNWAAEPLDSYEKALKFIRTTTTTTGLKVTAHLDTTFYPTGVKVSKRELANSPSDRNVFCQNGTTPSHRRCEVIFGRLLSRLCGFLRALGEGIVWLDGIEERLIPPAILEDRHKHYAALAFAIWSPLARMRSRLHQTN